MDSTSASPALEHLDLFSSFSKQDLFTGSEQHMPKAAFFFSHTAPQGTIDI